MDRFAALLVLCNIVCLVPACAAAAFLLPEGGYWSERAADAAERGLSKSKLSSDREVSTAVPSRTTSGPILTASEPGDPTQFDSSCVANPVVLPPSVTGKSKWQCYYYGNAGSWAGGARSFLPTGWIGLAESDDGVHWTKVVGNEEGGSILAPTGDADDWDGVQVGLGDVVLVADDEMHMYYFGGGGEEAMPGMPGVTGFRMRIGRARSTDGGRTWERMGMIFDYDENEGLFASWPRLMLPEDGKEKPWRMIYHAFNGQNWSAFGATSHDEGETWTRDGKMLGPGEEGSWDENGVGTRAVLRRPGGRWDMVYEAVDKSGTHRLGVAHMKEREDGSYFWEKAEGSDYAELGGPILQPGKEPLGPWTSQVIGTPYLVAMEDGSVRLYFVSRSKDTSHSIGLVASDTGDLNPASWKEVSL